MATDVDQLEVEEILARLERHAAARGIVLPPPGPLVATAPIPLEDRVPVDEVVEREHPVAETAFQLLATCSWALVIIAFEIMAAPLAWFATAVVAVAGLVGLARRMRLAMWWSLGVAIGVVIVLLS